jgi:hypothetical protein
MGQFFSRDEILAVQDLPFKDVPVPEWGGKTVRVLGLSAAEASDFAGRMVHVDDKGKVTSTEMTDFMPNLLSRTLADENNELLFTKKDVAALGKKSAKVMSRLFKVAMDLSGLDEMAEQLAVKNSDGTPEGDLPTA